MADETLLKILKKGPESWNKWRKQNRVISPDFRDADLSGANLTLANLVRANLEGANLEAADLTQADLAGANLAGADLILAKLTLANLEGADLEGASLSAATFAVAVVHEARFAKAELLGTVFANVDLSRCKGLEAVVHHAPSTIGIDTIYRSGGNIPESFMRGCGVPDDFITYAKSLVGKAIEYYSCFISYSTLDQEFAARLYADLQVEHVRCWFAPHDLQGGRKTHEQIDEAIRVYDKLLLILSKHSMDSEWVKAEILMARRRESKEKRRMLFPIRLVNFKRISEWKCLDPYTGEDSAAELRQYYIPDFSVWKTDHDKYKEEFAKLLAALRQGESR